MPSVVTEILTLNPLNGFTCHTAYRRIYIRVFREAIQACSSVTGSTDESGARTANNLSRPKGGCIKKRDLFKDNISSARLMWVSALLCICLCLAGCASGGGGRLSTAIWNNDVAQVKALLDKGENVNQGQAPPLVSAAEKGNPDIIKMLLEKVPKSIAWTRPASHPWNPQRSMRESKQCGCCFRPGLMPNATALR